MLLAEEWYASDVFWAAVGGVATLATGFAAAVITHRVGTPKRRLWYGIYRTTRLLAEETGRVPELEVRQRGIVLEDPYIVEFRMVSRGRHDIPSSSYDAGQPITFDMGVPVLGVLETENQPVTSPVPRMALDGTALKVGPSLLKKRHMVTYTLLVDGQPNLTSLAALEGVDLRLLRPAREMDVALEFAEGLGSFSPMGALAPASVRAFRAWQKNRQNPRA
ncbi:hypothetical protein [Streptomyces coffeae]|uniref:Uncharacterized protein n=1 Tax=Streptomyces coffeae TaxID=621382 RepID=A0ABS1N5K9_9ACTN|nr:hypothetical protein [Streptomyces coffeae]MBL1095170.1 hypothetical protein [Streptomyces coffeae]